MIHLEELRNRAATRRDIGHLHEYGESPFFAHKDKLACQESEADLDRALAIAEKQERRIGAYESQGTNRTLKEERDRAIAAARDLRRALIHCQGTHRAGSKAVFRTAWLEDRLSGPAPVCRVTGGPHDWLTNTEGDREICTLCGKKPERGTVTDGASHDEDLA